MVRIAEISCFSQFASLFCSRVSPFSGRFGGLANWREDYDGFCTWREKKYAERKEEAKGQPETRCINSRVEYYLYMERKIFPAILFGGQKWMFPLQKFLSLLFSTEQNEQSSLDLTVLLRFLADFSGILGENLSTKGS